MNVEPRTDRTPIRRRPWALVGLAATAAACQHAQVTPWELIPLAPRVSVVTPVADGAATLALTRAAEQPILLMGRDPAREADADPAPPSPPVVTARPPALSIAREFDPIYFDAESTELRYDSRIALRDYARWLENNPDVWVTLIGHSDGRGTPEYSLTLAMVRAWESREHLISLGVEHARLFALSYGQERPLAPGGDAGARALNRRTELLAFYAPEPDPHAAETLLPAAPAMPAWGKRLPSRDLP